MAQLNRKARFIGLGIVAAVVLVAAVFVAPRFPPQNAGRAIDVIPNGAPQIAAQDVILGDEKTRQEQKVVFADYLADATTLQNMSVNLAAMSMANKADLQGAARDLARHQADLRSRYDANMTSAIAAVNRALSAKQVVAPAAQLAAIEQELASMSAALHAKQVLGVQEMEALNGRLKNVAGRLQTKQTPGSARAELADAVGELQQRPTPNQARLLNAAAKLEAAQRDLNVRATLSSLMRDEQQYLRSIAAEAQTLGDIAEDLQALAPAQNPQAVSALNSFSTRLASEANRLEQDAVVNMQSRMELKSVEAGDLASMQELLASASRALPTRADAKALARVQRALSNFGSQLQNATSELEAALSANMHAELAACTLHLQRRDGLAQRMTLASYAEASAMGARAVSANDRFDNARTLAGMQAHLAGVNKALASKGGVVAALASRPRLGTPPQ